MCIKTVLFKDDACARKAGSECPILYRVDGCSCRRVCQFFAVQSICAVHVDMLHGSGGGSAPQKECTKYCKWKCQKG